MRPSILLAILMALAPTAATAQQANVLDDDLPHAFDDRLITLGNTRFAPDARLGWETTGATDHLSLVVPTGSGLLVSSDPNVDRSGVIAAGATYLGVCSDDGQIGGAAATECVVASHDGANARIQTLSGRLRLGRGGANIVDIDDSNGAFNWSFQGDPATQAELWGSHNALAAFVLVLDSDIDQTLWAADANGGRQFVVTHYDNRSLDHGYDALADPTLYVQGRDNPTAGAGVGAAVRIRYVAASDADATIADAGYIGTPAGGGPLRLDPATASVRLPRVMAAAPAEPHVCASQTDVGAVTYVDDTDDGVAGFLCACIATSDAAGVPNAWDWVRVADHTVACAAGW